METKIVVITWYANEEARTIPLYAFTGSMLLDPSMSADKLMALLDDLEKDQIIVMVASQDHAAAIVNTLRVQTEQTTGTSFDMNVNSPSWSLVFVKNGKEWKLRRLLNNEF